MSKAFRMKYVNHFLVPSSHVDCGDLCDIEPTIISITRKFCTVLRRKGTVGKVIHDFENIKIMTSIERETYSERY